jgi:short-subunit dehydrogenase
MTKKDKHTIVPDMTGKIAIITGANSGLGFEAANMLAKKNAHVILTGRNQHKIDAAKQSIITQQCRCDGPPAQNHKRWF